MFSIFFSFQVVAFLRWRGGGEHHAESAGERSLLYVSRLSEEELFRWNRRARESASMATAAKKATLLSSNKAACCFPSDSASPSGAVVAAAAAPSDGVVSANAVQDWSVASAGVRDDQRAKKIAMTASLIPEPSTTVSTKGFFCILFRNASIYSLFIILRIS